MNIRKALPLLVLPLAIMMLVPVATVRATTPAAYYVELSCYNSTGAAPPANKAFASFQGHSYTFTCPTGSGSHYSNIPIYNAASATFFAYIAIAGHKTYFATAFSPSKCEDGVWSYYPTNNGYIEVYIYTFACD